MKPRKTPEANLEKRRNLWFFLGMVGILAITLSAFQWTNYTKTEVYMGNVDLDLLEDEVVPPNVMTPPPPPPPPPQPTTVIEIVEDDEEIEDELEIEDLEVTEETEFEEVEVAEEPEEEEIFMVVEDMPTLPACENIKDKDQQQQCTQGEIIKYISQNTTYPRIAKESGIQGTVFVGFVVNEKGEVEDARVLREVDPRLDKEALRVVNDLPKFEPGKQRGKAVKVQYNVPVRFTLR
ncbi:energy transducer TonB [Halocola ammonii]